MTKVLFCRWNIVGEEDVLQAMEKTGLKVTVFAESMNSVDYDREYLKKLSDLLLKDQFSFVFSIDYVPVISRVCNVFHKMYVSWTVDSPEIMLYSKTLENPCNQVFLFDRTMTDTFEARNPGHIHYMPLGTNAAHWDQIQITEEDRRKYTADVSFVGSLYTEKNHFNQIRELPEYLKGYISGLIEAQLKVYGVNFIEKVLTDEIIEEFKSCVSWQPLGSDYIEDARAIMAHGFIGLKCTELERGRLLKALSERFDVDLYTKSDASSLPAVHMRGAADYREEMPKIFRLSRINLNLTSRPIQTGLPLRIYDIMGAGGFLLTNYQAELPEYFQIGRDLDVFENEKDLLNKTAYYLEHDDIRQEIADSGYRRVKELYTYEARIKDILQIVGIR